MGLESVVHVRVADLKSGLLRELVPAKVKGIWKIHLPLVIWQDRTLWIGFLGGDRSVVILIGQNLS